MKIKKMKIRKLCRLKAREQGVILIIALILMVIIALGTVASMRLSGADELVNSNTRSRILAMQAANAAVVACREGVFLSAKDWSVRPSLGSADEGVLWKTIGNWTATNVTTLATGFETYDANLRPQCMIENITDFMQLNSGSDPIVAYRITARGFSPNFQQDAAGVPLRGSQAWQQVVVGRRKG